MSKEAMKLALEALEYIHTETTVDEDELIHPAITALRQALANEALDRMAENARELGLDYEPAQQEPVAWVCEGSSSDEKHAIDYWPGDVDDLPIGTQLYTSPPAQRTWVGLTDEEVFDVWLNEMPAPDKVFYQKLCRSVEAKLKEKNNA